MRAVLVAFMHGRHCWCSKFTSGWVNAHAHIGVAVPALAVPPDGFAKEWDEEEFGRNIDYREYSFLNNTQVGGVGWIGRDFVVALAQELQLT